jgi:hypothetical protein
MKLINFFGILVMLAVFCSTTNSAALTTVSESADSFWNRTTSELWGPIPVTCQNEVFPFKTLIESKNKFRQDFAECQGHLTSQDPLEKLCISAVFNLKYVCQHKVKSDLSGRNIAESEIESLDDKSLCGNLSKYAAPIAANCGTDRACNLTSETAFDLKHRDKFERYCEACKKSASSGYGLYLVSSHDLKIYVLSSN